MPRLRFSMSRRCHFADTCERAYARGASARRVATMPACLRLRAMRAAIATLICCLSAAAPHALTPTINMPRYVARRECSARFYARLRGDVTPRQVHERYY